MFDEDLGDGGGVESALGDFFKFLLVIGDTAAATAEGEGGTDDDWIVADLFGDGFGFFEGGGDTGGAGFDAYFCHCFFEE